MLRRQTIALTDINTHTHPHTHTHTHVLLRKTSAHTDINAHSLKRKHTHTHPHTHTHTHSIALTVNTEQQVCDCLRLRERCIYWGNEAGWLGTGGWGGREGFYRINTMSCQHWPLNIS